MVSPNHADGYDTTTKVKNDQSRKSPRNRKSTLIPQPSSTLGKKRTERFCSRRSSEISANLFICASRTFLETSTSTDRFIHRISKEVQASLGVKDTESKTVIDNEQEYRKWMKQLQFPDTLQALFLSEKGLRKFQKIIQDQLTLLEKKSGSNKICTKHLPPISYYQIVENKSKSETDFVKVRKCSAVTGDTTVIKHNPKVENTKDAPNKNTEGSMLSKTPNQKYSSKGLLQIDEIKKDLISICAYIFKQTRIINELWKYLEKNSSSKHQINRENIKTITAGALNQHLNKLHSIRENLFKFNEKYRADLDKRIHLLKQISNYYKAEQQGITRGGKQ